MKMLLLALLLVAQRPTAPALQAGTVTGRLLNEDGTPAIKIRVSAMSIPDNKTEAPTLMTLAETDSSGRYRLTDVPVGRYYIVAGFVDSPTYYPRGTGPAGATPVNVTVNATVANIDFRIEKPSTGLTVSGRVITDSNPALGPLQVMLSGGNTTGYTNLNVPAKIDGTFEFARVRPGTYTITVNPSPISEPRTVIVADKDITGIELRVPWAGDVAGRVVVEGSGPVPPFTMLFSGGSRQANAFYQGANQTFRATLPEGFFVFTTSGLPSGLFLKSVTSGDTDLLAGPLRVARTQLPAEIIVTLGVSTPPPWVKLSGRVTGSRQSMNSISIYGPGGTLTASLTADGSFEFAKILPGSYTVSIPSTNGSTPVQPLTLVVPNRDVSGVELPLPALKEISGRVIVEDGGPLPRATLTVTPATEEQKRGNSSTPPSLAQLLVTTAGNRSVPMNIYLALQQDGSFKASLPEGRYPVTANIQTTGGSAPYSVKSFTYGSADLTKEPVVIAASDSAEMRLTFSAASSSWAKVTGRVVGLTASSASQGVPATVVLVSPTFMRELTATIRPDGSFEFPRVYSGTYQGRLNGVAPNLGIPPVEVNVASSDVTGLEFVIPSQKEISGRIILEGRGAMPRLTLPLTRISTSNSFQGPQTAYISINPQPDGTFKVTVPEGERQVGRPNPIPAGYTLKSVQYGSSDVANSPLNVRRTDTAELRLTFTTPDQPPVKISGKLTGLDAALFSRGPVSLNLSEPRYVSSLQATISPDGTFEFPAVFPGNYNVALSPSVNATIPPINVGSKELTGFEINVPRRKEIAGRVVLEGSGPMPRFSVPMNTVGPALEGPGGLSMITINPQTDGAFRVSIQEGERRAGPVGGLPPGYTVKSMTYGTIDLLSAPIKIAVNDDDELRITVTTPSTSPVKVTGKVTGLDSTMFSRGPVTVSMTATGYAAALQTNLATDGTFEFPDVFAGNYSARVTGPGIAAHQPVTVAVANAEVRNVEIVLPGQKEIAGRVIVEGAAPLPRFNFRPPQVLTAQRTPLQTQFLNITPAANGTFRLTLPEGERPLGEVNGLPPGYTLKAATYGTTDLLRDPLKIGKGDTGELVITLSAPSLKPVSVSGKVEGLDAAVVAQGTTRVVMASQFYAGNLNTTVRPDGTFEFPSVFPGAYTAQVSTPAGAGAAGSLAGSVGGPLAVGLVPVASPAPGGIPITVADTDVRNLSLSVPRQYSIVGRVEIEGGGPIPRIPLTFSTQTTTTGIATAVIPQPDGTLRFTLPEGERTARVAQLPPGLALKSMTYGAVDLRQAPLRVDANQQPAELRVTLEKTHPQAWVRVEGKVTGVPDDARNVRVSLTGTFNVPRTVPVNADGTFVFEQVFQGTSSVRLLGNIGETLQSPVNITVGAKDITNLEIVYRR